MRVGELGEAKRCQRMWQENKKSVGCDKIRKTVRSQVSQGESGAKGQAGRIRRRDLRVARSFSLRCSRCSAWALLS